MSEQTHAAENDALVELLSCHWPTPVFGCDCMPTDEETGMTETLAVSWEAHVAGLVLRILLPEQATP